MTDPTLATLRERHRPRGLEVHATGALTEATWTVPERCIEDGKPWPCDAERFRQALDAALAALRDTRSGLVSEHGHDVDFGAPWPSCLPIHIALNRATDVLVASRAASGEAADGD